MNQVQSLLERPKVYNNIDGVGELGIGFLCLGFSLFGFLGLHTPTTAVWHQMYALFIYVGVMLAIIHYGTKAIKNRITYPRTGFVDYRPRDKYWLPMGIGAVISLLVSVGFVLAVRGRWEMSTLASLVGLVFAASYVRIAMTVRWKWAIFWITAVAAVVIGALPAELLETLAGHDGLPPAIPAKAVGAFWLMVVVFGAALTMSGGISLWLYLHHTQAPAQEGQ